MLNILLTGSTGFVGFSVLKRLCLDGSLVSTALRERRFTLSSPVTTYIIDGVSNTTDWSGPLSCQQVVVHCAARVHVMRDSSLNPIDAFRSVNLLGTLNLARQAVDAGVKRFVFISSIGVNGSQTCRPVDSGIPWYGPRFGPDETVQLRSWKCRAARR